MCREKFSKHLFPPPPPPKTPHYPPTARKNKKLMKIKVQQQPAAAAAAVAPVLGAEPGTSGVLIPMVPRCMPQLVPTMLSVLKAIEPDVLFSGYDSTAPDTSSRLMSTLNRLGGQQVVSAVKWAKSLPGEGRGGSQGVGRASLQRKLSNRSKALASTSNIKRSEVILSTD